MFSEVHCNILIVTRGVAPTDADSAAEYACLSIVVIVRRNNETQIFKHAASLPVWRNNASHHPIREMPCAAT